MRSLNKVQLIGNIGCTPQTHVFPDGKMVANFTIATAHHWQAKQNERDEQKEDTEKEKQSADWHTIVCYGRLAEIAAQYGAKVIDALPLPQNWLGKPWACWQGAREAGGELFVFLDADTRLEAGGLQKILHSYYQQGGLLSVWPYHRMKRLYERLSALFNIIIMASMGSFTIRGSNARSLGAFGP